jgi:hypothetical protein
MKKSLEGFIHQSGRHKGNLRQNLLQCEGKFTYRDPHPEVEGVFFMGLINSKQSWRKSESFPELKGVQAPDGIQTQFIHQKSIKGAVKGKINQDALHIEGQFSQGDKHPQCALIVFHGYRDNGKQRWQTLQQYKDGKKHSRKYQSNWRKENPDLAKERGKRQYKKNWSDPKWKEAELAKRKVKRDNRTPEQINKDYERGVKYREKNAEKIKIQKAIEYLENREAIIKRVADWTQNNREARRVIAKNWKKNNRDKENVGQRARRKKDRRKRTKALNEFYSTHEIPKYLWHEDEFANEEDFQTALEHVIVNRLGLEIERWTFLEEIGVPDIYIPKLDLIVEVKLLASMWRTDDVVKQSLRYMDISPTVIVSLDGKPTDWTEKTFTWMTEKKLSWDELRTKEPPWFNQSELFDFLSVMKARL